MPRYIDADKLLDLIRNIDEPPRYGYLDLWDIEDAPTEDVQPVIYAEWELVNEDENVYMCSNCGDEFITIDGTVTENHMLYCPFCGAKMESDKP